MVRSGGNSLSFDCAAIVAAVEAQRVAGLWRERGDRLNAAQQGAEFAGFRGLSKCPYHISGSQDV